MTWRFERSPNAVHLSLRSNENDRFGHCERSRSREPRVVGSNLSVRTKMDCFVASLLAMTPGVFVK